MLTSLSAAANPIKLIDALGFIAPFLLFFIAAVILFSAQRYVTLGFFSIGFAITEMVVRLLKDFIRAPRPGPQLPFMGEKLSGEHVYGFPSGHAAEVAYTLAFMWFSNTLRIATPAFFYFGAFLAVCMLYQRWAYRRHTLTQLGGGVVVGAIMGWGIAWLAKQRLENKIGGAAGI